MVALSELILGKLESISKRMRKCNPDCDSREAGQMGLLQNMSAHIHDLRILGQIDAAILHRRRDQTKYVSKNL